MCAKHSIPFGPVLELDKAHEDPYVRDGHLLDVVRHPSEGEIRSIGIPVRFSATPATVRRLAPLPGQDTAEVLAETRKGSAVMTEVRTERIGSALLITIDRPQARNAVNAAVGRGDLRRARRAGSAPRNCAWAFSPERVARSARAWTSRPR